MTTRLLLVRHGQSWDKVNDVVGGPRGSVTLGRSLVVAPGSLDDGHYAVADLQARRAELAQLALPAA